MDSRLRQQLLELHYDLLPEAEAAELRARLASEPELAALLVEVEADARLLSLAARLEAPPLGLKVDVSQASKPAPPIARRGGDAKPMSRGAKTSYWSWALGLAAGVMLVVCLGGYQVHRTQVARLDREFPRIVLAGPARLTPNVVNRINVRTTTLSGEPLALNLVSTLHDAERDAVSQLLRQETDRDGNLVVEFTPKADGPAHYELRLARVQGNVQSPLARLPLSVDTPEYLTKVATDRPSYRPGDEVFYRSLTLSRADLKPIGESEVRYRAEDLAGNVVPGSELSGGSDRGVGNGAFQLPASAAFGEYRLVAESPENRFAKAEQRFFVAPQAEDKLLAEITFAQSDYAPGEEVRTHLLFSKSDGAPAAHGWVEVEATDAERQLWKKRLQTDALGGVDADFTLPTEIEGQPTVSAVATLEDQQVFATAPVPVAVERLEARFYPEGGDLIAGVENRVYFRVADQLNRPVEITGAIVDDDQHAMTEAATKLAGRGHFSLTPQAGRSYRLRLAGVDDASLWPSLPAVRADRALALHVPQPVIRDNEELKVIVHDRRGDTPVVVAVHCRDRQVAQTTAVTTAGVNKLKIPLGPDAGGVLRVTVFDCSQQAPRPVAERLVYRHDANRLTVALRGLKKGKYLPEEQVELEAQLWDREERPAAGAVLGVAVFDDALIAPREASLSSVATFFDLASQLDRPEDLEEMDLRLDTSPDAAVAIDLLLGTQGWRRFVDAPAALVAQQQVGPADGKAEAATPGLLVWDNLAEAQPLYEQRAQQLRSDQAQRWAMLMICGGVALAIALVLAALWRLVASVELALPSLAAAAGCVVLGVLLARSADQAGSPVSSVAFAKSVPITEIAFRAPEAPAAPKAATGAALDDRLKLREEGQRRAISKAVADESADVFREGAEAEGKAVGRPLDRDAAQPPGAAPEMEAVPPVPAPLSAVEEPAPTVMKQSAEPAPAADEPPPRSRAIAPAVNQPTPAAVETYAEPAEPADAPTAAGAVQQQSRSLDFGAARVDAIEPADDSLARQSLVRRQRSQLPPERSNFGKESAAQSDGVRMKAAAPDDTAEEALQEQSVPAQQAASLAASQYFAVRQYAHEPAAVIDATQLQAQPSLYWNPLAVADADGIARFQFYAGAGDATYRVRLDAHDTNGRLGGAETTFDVGFPFQLAETLPTGMTTGDRYDAPVEVANSSNSAQSLQMNVVAPMPALQAGQAEQNVALEANENRRLYVPLQAGEAAAKDVVVGIEGNTLAANDWRFSERVEQRLEVTSAGYPVLHSQAGWLRGETELVIQIPENPRPGTLDVRLWLYPGLPADFEHARAALGKLPQDNWNTQLAQAHVDRQLTGVVAGARVAQSPYGNAFGGFGGGRGGDYGPAAPENDGLTSYWSYQPELLGFRGEVVGQQSRAGGAATRYGQAMQRSSSSYAVPRGADSARAGSPYGGYARGPAAPSTARGFGYAGLAQAAPEVAATWGMVNQTLGAQAPGTVDLKSAEEFARKLHEPATTGVVANGLLSGGDEAAGKELLARLATWQSGDGSVANTKQEAAQGEGIPSSSRTANTAVAVLAWFKSPEYHDAAKKGVDWLVAQRRGGGFGSADDTYLALRALEAHAAQGYRPAASGVAKLSLGETVLAQQSYDAADPRLVTLSGFAAQLAPGENRLKLSSSSQEAIPYAIDVQYYADQPQGDPAMPVTLATSLSVERAELQQAVRLTAQVTNTSAAPQDYVVAELGVPAGLAPNPEQLAELQNQRAIDHFETRGRTLIPYWRSLAPNETRSVEFDLSAVAPGQFTSPASSVYRLPTPEARNWTAPVKIEVSRPAE